MVNKDDNFVLDEQLSLDKKCEECLDFHDSVANNLIMHSYKICDSCKISKIIFPI